ncbi:MAG: hypothetical protein Q8919_09900 [Bacteroidota bacterium]|nr:hypothetical protein [Bacteroidota bacterium]
MYKVNLNPAKAVNGHNVSLANPETISRMILQLRQQYDIDFASAPVCELHITLTIEREEEFGTLLKFFKPPKGYAPYPKLQPHYFNGIHILSLYEKSEQAGIPADVQREIESLHPTLFRLELRMKEVSKYLRQNKLLKGRLTLRDLTEVDGYFAALRYLQIALPRFLSVPDPPKTGKTKQTPKAYLKQLACTEDGFAMLKRDFKEQRLAGNLYEECCAFRLEVLNYQLGNSLRSQIASVLESALSKCTQNVKADPNLVHGLQEFLQRIREA